MGFEYVEQYLGRYNLIRVLMHHGEYLVYGRWGQPHTQAYGVQPSQFGFVLFLVDIHKEQQPVKLNNAFGLGLKDDFIGLLLEKLIKGVLVDSQLGGYFKKEIIFGNLHNIICPGKGYQFR